MSSSSWLTEIYLLLGDAVTFFLAYAFWKAYHKFRSPQEVVYVGKSSDNVKKVFNVTVRTRTVLPKSPNGVDDRLVIELYDENKKYIATVPVPRKSVSANRKKHVFRVLVTKDHKELDSIRLKHFVFQKTVYVREVSFADEETGKVFLFNVERDIPMFGLKTKRGFDESFDIDKRHIKRKIDWNLSDILSQTFLVCFCANFMALLVVLIVKNATTWIMATLLAVIFTVVFVLFLIVAVYVITGTLTQHYLKIVTRVFNYMMGVGFFFGTILLIVHGEMGNTIDGDMDTHIKTWAIASTVSIVVTVVVIIPLLGFVFPIINHTFKLLGFEYPTLQIKESTGNPQHASNGQTEILQEVVSEEIP